MGLRWLTQEEPSQRCDFRARVQQCPCRACHDVRKRDSSTQQSVRTSPCVDRRTKSLSPPEIAKNTPREIQARRTANSSRERSPEVTAGSRQDDMPRCAARTPPDDCMSTSLRPAGAPARRQPTAVVQPSACPSGLKRACRCTQRKRILQPEFDDNFRVAPGSSSIASKHPHDGSIHMVWTRVRT